MLHLIGILAQAAYPLVVCLIMAATIDELFLHRLEVMIPVNLNAFISWCATATEEELDKAFDKIYITVHRIEETTLEDLPLESVRIERSDLDRIFTIPQRHCRYWNCRKCRTGRGGYSFRWVGPWTCIHSLGDGFHEPHVMMERYTNCGCGLDHIGALCPVVRY